MELINVPELKKTGVDVGGLFVGSLATHIGLNQLKKYKLPASGIACVASGYAAHLVKNPLGKSVLKGACLFSGLKFLSLAVNGPLNGLGEDTAVPGLKIIPEKAKAIIRKYIPNLGEGGSDYNEMGTDEPIRVESPEIEGVNDEIEGVSRLFRKPMNEIQVFKGGQPVQHNGKNLTVSLLGSQEISLRNFF